MWRFLGRWSVRFLYLAVLAGLFVAMGYVGFSQFVRRGVTPVPGLVGLEPDAARGLIEDRGLRLVVDDEGGRFSDEIPAGMILEQSPSAGSLAKRGGRVDVVLSRGLRLVEVPDLAGKALPAAQVTLAAVGLVLGGTSSIFADGAVGTVVAQVPSAGEPAERGAPVSLYLAGEGRVDTFLMPDFVDRPYRYVRHFLDVHGFRVGSVKYESYEGVSRPVVLRQFPLPGHPVRRSEVISLVVAAVPAESPLSDEGPIPAPARESAAEEAST